LVYEGEFFGAGPALNLSFALLRLGPIRAFFLVDKPYRRSNSREFTAFTGIMLFYSTRNIRR